MEASLAGLEMVFRWLVKASWEAAVLIVLIFLAQRLLARWLEPRWRYALWMLVVVRLALPIQWESEYSIFNFARIRSFEQAVTPRPFGRAGEGISEKPLDSQVELTFGASKDTHDARFNAVSADEFGAERPVSISSGAAPQMDSKAIASPSTDRWNQFTSAWTWARGLAAVWVAGVLLFIGCIALETWRWQSRLAKRKPMHDTNVLAELTECQSKLSVAKPLPLEETAAVASPALFGLFRPRLLLPEGMAETFSKSELRFVFLHELAHLKRNDIAVNWLMTILLAIHWFNPFVWLAFRRMRVDRELACDSLALAQLEEDQRTAYGQTILKLLEGFRQGERVPGMVGILEDKEAIKQRLRMIARFRPSKRWSMAAGAVMATMAFFTLTRAQTLEPRNDAHETATPTKRPLIFKVIDAETRQGLDAALKASICDEKSCRPLGAFNTDSLGMHAFNLPGNLTGLTIWVRCQGYVPKVLSWSKFHNDRIPSEYTVRLDRGVSIGGIVQDENGKPIHGAKVSISGAGMDSNEVEHIGLQGNFQTETTDEAGRWTSQSIPANYEQISLYLSHPEFSSVSVPYTKELRQGKAVMVMKKGTDISGIVLSKDGLPIPGARVRLGASKFVSNPVAGLTDAHGRFQFKHQPPGVTMITVQAKGFSPAVQNVRAGEAGADARFELEIGGVIKGRVVDEEGKPVAGVIVAPEYWNYLQLLDWDGRTDADGRFLWDSAPADPVNFFIGKQGYYVVRGIMLRPGSEEAVITLKKSSKIEGLVVDASTGEPIPGFTVFFGESFSIDGRSHFTWQRGMGKKGHEGKFELELDEITGQATHLLIEAKGYQPFISPAFENNSGGRHFDVKLEKSSGYSGIVVLPNGRPAVGASVILCSAEQRAYMDQEKTFRLGLYESPHSLTDESGAFTLSASYNVEAIVVAHSEGFVDFPITAKEATGLKLVLRPWGKVEGTLKIGKQAGANQEVWIVNQHWREQSFPNVQLFLKTKTDAAGRFAFEAVPPGEHRIHRVVSLDEEGLRRGPIPRSNDQPIVVRTGEVTQVSIGGTGRPIVGKITVSDPSKVNPDWVSQVHFLHTYYPEEPVLPNRSEFDSAQTFQEAFKKFAEESKVFWGTELGKKIQREKAQYFLKFHPDGSFRIDDVPPGTYELALRLSDSPGPQHGFGNQKGFLRKRITVDPIPGGRTDEPLDLGVMKVNVAIEKGLPQLAVPLSSGR